MNSHEGGFLSVGKVVKLLKIQSSLELLLVLACGEQQISVDQNLLVYSNLWYTELFSHFFFFVLLKKAKTNPK